MLSEPAVMLSIVLRWLHILAAITAVGGSIFARWVVFPSLDPLPADQRGALHAAMRARWSRFVAVAIALLLVSGLVNFVITARSYQVPPWYHMVFGVKFLLAMVIFAVASLLSGRSPAADAIRQHATRWLDLNIALAVLVVCLSGVLRAAPRTPKSQQPATPNPTAFREIVANFAAETTLNYSGKRRPSFDHIERIATSGFQ